MAHENDPTREYGPVLTRLDLDRVETKIDSLRTDFRGDLHEIAEQLKIANDRHNQNDVWKAQIDMRLAQGVERMNGMQKEIDARIKKETIVTLIAGATMAGGGTGAILMKLFGG